MSNTPPTSPPTPLKRVSPALIGAGILVMALGFGLPMLTAGGGSDTPVSEATAKQAASATPATPAPIQPPAATGLGAALLKLVVGLVVVCGLCVLVAKWMGQKPPATPGAMEVVASIAVGPCVVHLVHAGSRRLLIGTDLGGVKSLVELPGPVPEAPAETPPTAAEMPASPSAPTPTTPPTHEEILKLLLQLRTRTTATPPG
jgi:flagellar protein FliO/FliZ